jgi:hypothetical protein
MPPGNFHSFNQRVYKSVKDTSKVPESTWASNPELVQKYLVTSEKHDAVYHEATYGHKLSISERDLLQAQLIVYLDEMALLLETAVLRNPDILLCSGFNVAKERRGSSRTKAAITASAVSTAEQQEPQT